MVECLKCPRLAKCPVCQPLYCHIHHEDNVRCTECKRFASSKVKGLCYECREKPQVECREQFCSKKAIIPYKKPKLCLRCFGKKNSFGDGKLCPKEISEKFIYRCIFCLEFTTTGSVIAYGLKEKLHCGPFYSCYSCAIPKMRKRILEYLRFDPNLTQMVVDYLLSFYQPGDCVPNTANVKIAGIDAKIVTIDIKNGLYSYSYEIPYEDRIYVEKDFLCAIVTKNHEFSELHHEN